MANLTLLRGDCPAPFLDIRQFSTGGGFVEGRICAPPPLASDPDLQCCLACPFTEWIYPPEFVSWYRAAESINVSGVILCLFLLLSYAFLPVEKTRRHYLSVCLVLSIIILALGFVVPWAVQPPQCHDLITPNDMFSNLTCAWSGALIIAGGLAVDMWIFIRVLSMHLQICWDVQPGKKFFYGAQGGGWLVIAALFSVTLTMTGVSFRFGDACHVNSKNSLLDFWGPCLVIAGLATLVQTATFGYCLQVYIRNLWTDEAHSTNSTGLPSHAGSSLRVQSARQVYRRVKKIIWLQWRGILIVVFILTDVIFFSVTFVYLNNAQEMRVDHYETMMPWILCLIEHPDDHEECIDLGADALVSMHTVNAILIMLSLAGVQAFLLLARWSMFTGWVELFRKKFTSKSEFVSLDARHQSQARSYEMYRVDKTAEMTTVVTPKLMSPSEVFKSPYGSPNQEPKDYFSKDIRHDSTQPQQQLQHHQSQRSYRTPSRSFSSPRSPSISSRSIEWDPRSTHARGGLGFHPTANPTGDEYDTGRNQNP